MNLDELQSVQSRERQASSLQHLRASFYEDAGEFIGELREKRNQEAAKSDSPFDDPEVERLSDDIKTAERTVESIYERRVGKVVKLASIAAADMPYDDDGLTTEEEQLFERLVDAIERNRDCVLSVLDGEAPALNCNPVDTVGEPSGTGTESTPGADPATGPEPGTDPPTGAGPGREAGTESGEAARPDPGTGQTGAESERGSGGRSDPPDATVADDGGVDRHDRAGRDSEEATTTEAAGNEGRPTPPDLPPDDESDATASEATVDPALPEEKSLDIGGAMGGDTPGDGDRPTARDEPVPAAGDDVGAGSQAAPETGPPDRSGVERSDASDVERSDASGTMLSDASGTAAESEGASREGSPRPVDRGGEATREGAPDDGGSGDESVERTTVRVTADVGGIYCVDGRSYDLSAEDVVTLPAPNADGLVSKGAAQRLD